MLIKDAGYKLVTGIEILVVHVVDICEKLFPSGIDTGEILIAGFFRNLFGFIMTLNNKNADL
jgi:hypothetical protein